MDASRDTLKAFTLVELAIVLVIVGLVVGGIAAGKSLIRNSQVNSAGMDANSHRYAINQFRDKYGYPPGDLPTATQVWGRADGVAGAGDCAAPSTDVANVQGTCNGNGNGYAEGYEVFRAWQQLVLAGLLTGGFTGVATDGSLASTPGTNVPPGKIRNSGFFEWSWGRSVTDNTTFFAGEYYNTLAFGGSTVTSWPYGGIISAKEAYVLDDKFDDGRPGTGIIRTPAATQMVALGNGNCVSSDSAATAVYNRGVSGDKCMLLFMDNYKPNRSE